MPNPWGSSLPSEQFYYSNLIGNADVAVPNGVETNVMQATSAVAWGPGSYVPAILGSVAVLIGAAPLTQLRFGLRVNNGTDQAFNYVVAGMLIANAQFMAPLCMFGAGSSPTLWYPVGANIQLSCLATGGSCTILQAASQPYYGVYRVQDGS